MNLRRSLQALCLLCAPAWVASLSPAEAQVQSIDDRKTEARDLAMQGDAAFKVGRCDRAIPLWQQANTRFPAPTILFRIARCQALLGRVVEATATLENVLALPEEPDAPPAFREAKEQAASELPAMRARVAYLTVVVESRDVSVTPEVRVDDRTVSPQQKAIPIDPGSHVVRVLARDASWERTVLVQEGGHETLRVGVGIHRPLPPSRSQRTVGLVIGGLGLASLAAGAYFSASASMTARDLDGVCGSDRKRCPPDRGDDIDRLKTHAIVADLTLGAGAALFAAGAIVVLTEPAPKSEQPRIEVFPVGMGAAMRGSF